MSDQLKVFSRLAVEQLMDVLKDVLAKEPVPDVPATVLQDLMPANLLQKVWSAILDEPLVQEVKVSIAHLKSFQYELPFMPDRIDYKIGTCCDEIVYNRGLFTPCSKPCKEGNKCRAHFNASSNFGDFQSRLATWDNGNGIGKMQVTPETDPTRIKAFKEVTYGEFCQKAKLSEDIVNKALRDANFLLSVDSRNFVVPVKARKVRGRPAKKLVEEVHDDVSLDDKSEKSSDESEVEEVEKIEEQEEQVEVEVPKVEEQEVSKVEERVEEQEPKVEEKKPKLARPRIKKPKAEVEAKVSKVDGSESESEEKPKPKPRVRKPKAERPGKSDGETESESESEEKPKPKPRVKKVKEVKGTAMDGAGTSLDAEQFEAE